jgi:hypothetical protein
MFVDSFRAGACAPARKLSYIETHRVSRQNKFVKLVLLVGFITKKDNFGASVVEKYYLH